MFTNALNPSSQHVIIYVSYVLCQGSVLRNTHNVITASNWNLFFNKHNNLTTDNV